MALEHPYFHVSVLKMELWVMSNPPRLVSSSTTATCVGAVSGSDAFPCDKLSNMEIVRSDFAMETEMDSGVILDTQLPRGNSANPLNSLRNIGTELR